MSACLEGKTAIVTGAAGGFGVVLVRALLAHRSNVMALDINRDGLYVLQDSLSNEAKRRFSVTVADISDYADCETAVGNTLARLGGLHILITH